MIKVKFEISGDTSKTEAFLEKMASDDPYADIEIEAQRGVDALRAATPVDSGITADSWSYEIRQNESGLGIYWLNDQIVQGFSVVVGLQYGHGTRTGGYVQGRDFINPALASVFDDIANNVWKEVQGS